MKLHGQQKTVFEYIQAHPRTTIREIREATGIQKPDMRISEINFAYQKSLGVAAPDLKDDSKNVIINLGRNGSREVLKSIHPAYKPKPPVTYEYDPIRNVMVQRG
jgi:hypothetical protein